MANLIAGKKSKVRYKGVELPEIVGKTIEAITTRSVEGEYGNNTSVNLLFKDGTKHSFIIPGEDE